MKKNKFADTINAAARSRALAAAHIARTQTLDKVVITLGQSGYTPEQIDEFLDSYLEVEQDFCEEVLEDAEDDKDMVYAKSRIDRVIQQYVSPERFEPYDVRYKVK